MIKLPFSYSWATFKAVYTTVPGGSRRHLPHMPAVLGTTPEKGELLVVQIRKRKGAGDRGGGTVSSQIVSIATRVTSVREHGTPCGFHSLQIVAQ